ncbi:MAG: tetratricopeptide repeat protein [Xanthomonadales bacterium]|nr:tetratricopeptide repeat protein [Xanthomonadales bacterium]
MTVASVALLIGCASTAPGPAAPGHTPQDDASDEAGLWYQMARFESQLAHSPARVQDAQLEGYLRELSCKVADDYCGDLRVYLLRAPYFNASMAPNGVMLVWTGLLLRVEDEAQLAFVLGHELAHFRHRDTLLRWRRIKSTESALAGLSVVGGAFGASIVGVAGALTGYASLFAYNRDQERAADVFGLGQMWQAGYDPTAPARLWQSLLAEDAVRDKDLLSGVFATHPATAERVQNLQQMAAGIDCGSDCQSSERRQRERYQSQIQGWRAQWLADELGRRHYRQSEVLLTRLQQMPEYGLLADYYLAELYRLRQQPGDLQRALAAYDRAAASPQQLPPEWSRQRGQLRRKLGDEAGAAADLSAYLKAVPDAPDRALIEQWIQELVR